MKNFFKKVFNNKRKDLSEINYIFSLIDAKIIPLSEIEDEVFSSGAMGEGIGLCPLSNNFYSPVNGIILSAFPTGHAFAIQSDDNVEILLHIGMDTVELEGQGFKVHVRNGQTIKQGDLIVSIDKDYIENKGYSLITPLIITNSSMYDMTQISGDRVNANETIFALKKMKEKE